MMREIEWRGMNTGEWGWKREIGWVYGHFVDYFQGRFDQSNKSTPTIFWVENGTQHRAPIIPDTLGQYTGLKDRNEVKIFEGDILSVKEESMFAEFEHVGVVEIKPEALYIDFPDRGTSIQLQEFMDDEYKVIGNIHQHRYLLKARSK